MTRTALAGLITALSALIDLRKANPAPLYYQLAQGVETLIDGGTLSSGDQLPPMAKIASSLRINTGTVRSAWAYLEKQGTITREASHGRLREISSEASFSTCRPTRTELGADVSQGIPNRR